MTRKPKLPMNKLRLAASLWVINEEQKKVLEEFFAWLEQRDEQ